MTHPTAGDRARAAARGRPESWPPALPPALRGPLLLLAVAAAAVAALLAARYTGTSSAGDLDRWLQNRLIGQPSWAHVPAVLVDFVAEPVGAALSLAVLGGCCLLLRRPRLAVLAVVAPLLSGAVTTALKAPVGRTINGGYLAYPSGHTAFATALALVVALLVVSRWQPRPWAALTLVLGSAAVGGVAMGWAQVYLLAHYPTDTLGGFCTALVVVPATAALIDWAAR